MKFLAGIREFRDAFAVASRFVAPPGKSASPVTAHAKLTVSAGSAVLAGHDPGRGVGARVAISGVNVERDGQCLVPKAVVEKILKAADDETVTLSLSGPKLSIKGASASWTVPTIDPELFPDPEPFPADPAFAIDAIAFGLLVARTIIATDPKTSRWALGGMLVQWEGESASFEATDGRKVVSASASIYPKGAMPAGVRPILPAEGATLLASIFREPCPAVEVGFTRSSVFARCGGAEAVARLMEGEFPNLDRSRPKKWAGTCPGIPADAFRRAFDQASAVASGETTAVRMRLSSGVLAMTSAVADSGSSEVDFALAWDGPDVVIGMLPSQLSPILKAIGDSPFTLSVAKGDPVIRIECDGMDSLVMPFTLPE